jgi:hypothetical protein
MPTRLFKRKQMPEVLQALYCIKGGQLKLFVLYSEMPLVKVG